jgi:Methyltransferase domain
MITSILHSKFLKTEVGTKNTSTRQKWIAEKLSDIPTGQRILDAGAGEQQYKKYCNHLDYVSQDFGEYNPANAPVGLQMEDWNYGKLDIVSDITAIPEPDNSFDVVVCFELLEMNGNYFEYVAQELRRTESTARNYTTSKPSCLELICINVLLKMLDRLSKADKSSNELLAFGLHVVAVKEPRGGDAS